MRSGIRGVLAGALALVALQTVVQPGASGRVGGLLQVPSKFARRFLDPTIPAIPDHGQQQWAKNGNGTQDLRGRTGATAPVRRYPDPWIPPQVATPTKTGGD